MLYFTSSTPIQIPVGQPEKMLYRMDQILTLMVDDGGDSSVSEMN
jgi:hypothetical protein